MNIGYHPFLPMCNPFDNEFVIIEAIHEKTNIEDDDDGFETFDQVEIDEVMKVMRKPKNIEKKIDAIGLCHAALSLMNVHLRALSPIEPAVHVCVNALQDLPRDAMKDSELCKMEHMLNIDNIREFPKSLKNGKDSFSFANSYKEVKLDEKRTLMTLEIGVVRPNMPLMFIQKNKIRMTDDEKKTKTANKKGIWLNMEKFAKDFEDDFSAA